jgi:mono/diheme cytochrome c family protein
LRRSGRVTIGGAGLAAIAVVVLLASGCGYGGVATAGDHPDLQNGKALFSSTCGSCHTLQAAGTSGTVGPNLDNAFVEDRTEGYDSSAIENVVLDQIRLGSGPIATYTKAEHGVKGLTSQTQMPPNLVTGQNAIDIAAYVASVAGTGGYTTAGPLGKSGAAIFKGAGCAGCHTLKAAGSTGTVGPNLDQLANALTLAIVVRQVTNGGAIMPAFKGKLTSAQIQAVAQYVTSVAGK